MQGVSFFIRFVSSGFSSYICLGGREQHSLYQTKNGARLYNPRSVVCALEDAVCQSYWTRTGKMDEVLFFLKYNIGDVRDDVVKMVNNTPVRIDIKKEYSAGQESPDNRKDIYFSSEAKKLPGIVLELKVDDTPESAIAQIKNKEYCEKLRRENVETILAVGLSYDKGRKEHRCVIEEM